MSVMDADAIRLNIGGVEFLTTRTTLSMQDGFFRRACENMEKRDNILFVDRDPTHFRYVLNWMRGSRYLPCDLDTVTELTWEADFYCLHDLKVALEALRQKLYPGRLVDVLRDIFMKLS